MCNAPSKMKSNQFRLLYTARGQTTLNQAICCYGRARSVLRLMLLRNTFSRKLSVLPCSGGIRGLSPEISLSPTAKHIGQESEGELLCENFRFRWYVQSKSVNDVSTVMLRLLGDFRRQNPVLGYCPPPNENSWRRHFLLAASSFLTVQS